MAKPQIEQEYTWHYSGPNRTFGAFLKRQRVVRGLSRHSLAVMSGIQERRLDALELNQSPPSYADINHLAAVLETSVEELLEAAGYLKREQGA